MAKLSWLCRAAWASALLIASACTGVLGSGSDSGPGSSPGSDTGGDTGGPGEQTTSDRQPLVVRRLNRLEYNNTVRDLLGTELRPADEFPADDLGAEFSTVGSALSLSPAYVRAYEEAAYALIDDLLEAPEDRRGRVISCDVFNEGEACARSILRAFARRAWRRPVLEEHLESLMLPITTAREIGAEPGEGLRHALAAVLLSPFFVFKLEIDPDLSATEPRPLEPHELATRLSYALWSTMPDEALSAAADSGALTSDAELKAQIERMLADRRSDSLLDSFAAEWLDFAHLESHEFDAEVLGDASADVLRSMKLEARNFIRAFLTSERPAAEMMSARFTFVDATLAGLYGLPDEGEAEPGADGMWRVDTSSVPRSGLLTLGALLTTTSLPSRTSPVKRGDFVISRLMCQVIPPPPPGVATEPPDVPGLTLRERMDLHRDSPACNGCHAAMDPIGFGLENYDAVGRFRTHDGDLEIDASGKLPDGTEFEGAVELGAGLAEDPRLSRCITRKFTTFAVGRLLANHDNPWVEQVTAEAEARGGSLGDIIKTVLLSEAFRSRTPARP
ncbi:DUF1592 domain-containing protein [Sorangium sp. So ce1099]|uniref:DUF1592 domain-containing protein n=1 Tax=Sorangium sp. So ce1099 TaxID=3133331 RepID=UPI003F6261CA